MKYRWAVEILEADGTRAGQKEVTPDLEPVAAGARLQYLRRKGPEAAGDFDRPVEMEPVWQAKLGEPYVAGIRASIGGEVMLASAPTAMFRPAAAAAAAERLREQEKKEEPEKVLYLVTAYEAGTEANGSREPGRFRFTAAPTKVPVRHGSWPAELGALPGPEGEMGVRMPGRVLDEIRELTEAYRGVETGGVLIGHLRWDAAAGDLFADVTEQIHARDAVGDAMRLQFTAECWRQIRAVMELRGEEEQILGWWHSHCGKEFCKNCPVERQRTCGLQEGFLSEHDKLLHRTVFPQAYATALVATDTAFGEMRFALFGNREGVLERRGYSTDGVNGGETRKGDEACAEQSTN